MRRIGTELFARGLTAALVLEYEAVLKRPGLVPFGDATINEFLDYVCRCGKLCAVHFNVRPAAADPGDDLVIEAAIASNGGWIVTHNPSDMIEADRYGVELISPGDALRRMGVNR